MRRKQVALASLLAIIMLSACSARSLQTQDHILPSSQPQEGQNIAGSNVRVIGTQDFGQELMFERKVEAAAISAMAALEEVATVETGCGGGFVDSIDGIRSGFTGSGKVKTDWFVYVNGIQCNVGALDYVLHPGDIAHWDFHEWSLHQSIPATVGAFPEPFLHGYGGSIRPTLIVYSDSLEDPARKLEGKLTGIGMVGTGTRNFAELSVPEKEDCNLILLDTIDNGLISEMDRNWKRMGFFVRSENRRLVVLNTRGEPAMEFGSGAGVVQATQNPWNPDGVGACENVVWIVTGTDETGVISATEALLERTTEFSYAFAAVVVNGEIIRIPQ